MKALLTVAAIATAAAAGIHLAVAPEHFREWWGFGAFFVVCGAVQLAWAAAWPSSGVAGIAGNVSLIALWALSRTAGLPFGPDAGTPEAIGPVDVATVLVELIAVVALVVNHFAVRGEWSPFHQLHEETT